MDPSDKNSRMKRMRQVVKEQNVYRWASELITQLCDIRLQPRETSDKVNERSVA
jgi:trehalose-6-phosphate synthase